MNTLEIIGFVTCLISVFFSIKQHIWTWFFGLISIVCYGLVFYQSQLFANVALQVFFLFFSIKGLALWNKKNKDGLAIAISNATKKELLYTVILIAFFTGILVGFLDKYTLSDVPFLDAITALLSIAAQILMGKKRIEHWFIWIATNLIFVVLFFQKQLFLSAILYTILFVMAIIGYVEWRKILLTANSNKS